MGRQKQIYDAGLEYQDSMDEFQKYHTYPKGAFIDGAKWADENPKDGMVSLDKVEKYLRENIILYVWATDLDKREEWFHNFRKAMEK